MSESYFWGILTGASLAPFLWFVRLAVEEAFIKPLAIGFAQTTAKKFLFPAFDVMDELLVLPDQWERFVDEKTDWVKRAVLPEVDTFPLTEDQIDDLADLLVKRFDLQTFLDKAHGQRRQSV